MKKLFILVCALALFGILAFAQDSNPTPAGKTPDKVTLNPQPEPPGVRKSKPIKKTAGSQDELNPQPEPPGVRKSKTTKKTHGSKGELNPQPLPPGAASKVELNPQPLPPGARKPDTTNPK